MLDQSQNIIASRENIVNIVLFRNYFLKRGHGPVVIWNLICISTCAIVLILLWHFSPISSHLIMVKLLVALKKKKKISLVLCDSTIATSIGTILFHLVL